MRCEPLRTTWYDKSKRSPPHSRHPSLLVLLRNPCSSQFFWRAAHRPIGRALGSSIRSSSMRDMGDTIVGADRFPDTPEKVLALDTARRLATILRSKGFRVIETRTRDVFVPLESRAADLQLHRGTASSSAFTTIGRRAGAPAGSKSITSVLDHGVLPPTSFDKPDALTPPTTVESNATISASSAKTAARRCSVNSASFPTRRTTDTCKTLSIASAWPNASLPGLSRSDKARGAKDRRKVTQAPGISGRQGSLRSLDRSANRIAS